MFHHALVLLRSSFLLPLVFFKLVNTSRGPRQGYCRLCSVYQCGCFVEDSFVGPGMHSLAVKSTAWLWLIVLFWVSIQPVCHILTTTTTKKEKPTLFWPDYPDRQLWHPRTACWLETGQVMTSRETWLSQVFISHGCCSQRVTSWRFHYNCRHSVDWDILKCHSNNF